MARTHYGSEFRQDVGYGWRVLRRAPGFTAVAIATLALGIGASTAIFTVVESVLLRPLRFVEPQRLTMIRPTSGSRVSREYLYEWRRQSRTLLDMAGWQDVSANLTDREEPLEVLVDRATTNFFAVLGTPAQLGRTFTTKTDLSHAEAEVVLSHGFWQRRYGGDSAVLGKPITLDGETFTIVGVMPEGFTIRTNELAESRAELWMSFRLVPGSPAGMGGFLNVVGRLAPGVTLAQSQEEVSLIARRIEQAHPSQTSNWGANLLPLHEATVKDVRLSLVVLSGAVGILLLIACVNVASLVWSRAATRRTEVAIRLSLGATASRLVRQLLTESLVLASIGGVVGVLLALWGTKLLVSTLPSGLDIPRTREIDMDPRGLVFALFVTIFTGILFGLVPSIASIRSASHSALRETGRGSTANRSRHRAGGALIVTEVALAVLLLAAAGLLGRSFWELSRVNPGFQPDQVLTMRTTLPSLGYDSDDRIRGFNADLLDRIRNLPGVRAVGTGNYLPLSNVGVGGFFEIVGRPKPVIGEQPASWVSVVSGRYFEAMGIPLVRGRLPGPADTVHTDPVVVIDEALARRYWAGADPIGTRITWRKGEAERRSGEIIGVVRSVRWATLTADPQPTTYFWLPQDPRREITIAARVTSDPIGLSKRIAAQVRDIDPNQPVAEIRAMQDFVSADLARPRFTMLLLGSFAGAALLLAVIGLYGVIAFSVTERTREIGVRLALGAQPRDVLRLVMHQGMLLVGLGLVVGIGAALALGRVVAGLLYGVTPRDPSTLLAVTLFLTVVAMLAIYFPARRATRVDPMTAMKTE